MEDQTRDSLRELLSRWVGPADAERAYRQIEATDRYFHDYPAPEPEAAMIARIKARMTTTVVRRRRTMRALRRCAAAAAVVAVALIGLLGRAPTEPSGTFHAAILPSAVWESQDLARDDFDLAYLASQVRRIEAQVRELEAGEMDGGPTGELEELKMELMQIDVEFWKG